MMDILNKKNVLLSLMMLFASSFIFASCGSCQEFHIDMFPIKNKTSIQKKSSSLININILLSISWDMMSTMFCPAVMLSQSRMKV